MLQFFQISGTEIKVLFST